MKNTLNIQSTLQPFKAEGLAMFKAINTATATIAAFWDKLLPTLEPLAKEHGKRDVAIKLRPVLISWAVEAGAKKGQAGNVVGEIMREHGYIIRVKGEKADKADKVKIGEYFAAFKSAVPSKASKREAIAALRLLIAELSK